MHDTLPLLEKIPFPALRRSALTTIQVNLGYRCNQSCLHCHVAAGPNRTEAMSEETLALVVEVLGKRRVATLDVTGGAPELHPGFRRLVAAARDLGVEVMDRCNLTILLESGQEDVADFLAGQQVEIVASLPCYLEDNVDRQRGKGVFEKSIAGLRKLNALGYGDPRTGLTLNFVFNPQGPSLPPNKARSKPTTSGRCSNATASSSTRCSFSPTCRSSASARCSSPSASSTATWACCRARIGPRTWPG